MARSAALAAVAENPWFFELRQTRHSSSVQLNYQIRFDKNDLHRAPRRLAEVLAAPWRGMQPGLRGLLSSTRVNLYGLRMRPFFYMGRPGVDRTASSVTLAAPAQSGFAAPLARIDLAVYLEDARRDVRREARRWLITTLFDAALPQARGVDRWQKEAVAQDLLDMSRLWRSEL